MKLRGFLVFHAELIAGENRPYPALPSIFQT